MRPKTPKDMERYQALLMHWFREEPAWTMNDLLGKKQSKLYRPL